MNSEAVSVPSNQPVTLEELFFEEADEVILRARFLAPHIARAQGLIAHEVALADMAHLCQSYILPLLASEPVMPTQIIVSLSDIALPFGEADPQATQFFEAYRIADGTCISEMY
jgi:hypothetical protein